MRLQRRPPVPAFQLLPGSHASFEDVTFQDFDIAIRGAPGATVRTEGVQFDNVAIPFDMPAHGPSSVCNTTIINDPKLKRSFSGWTKTSGPPLPVYCDQCKTITPSKNYNFSGAFFNSWGNEDTCLACGNVHAKLSEGSFDLTQEAIKIIRGPDFTYEMVRSLSVVYKSLESREIVLAEAINRANSISSTYGSLIRRALKIGRAHAQLVLLITPIALGYWQIRLQQAANASSDISADKILDAICSLQIRPSGVCRNEVHQNDAATPAAKPTNAEAPTEARSVVILADKKPKARHIRKKSDASRRRALASKRHPNKDP